MILLTGFRRQKDIVYESMGQMCLTIKNIMLLVLKANGQMHLSIMFFRVTGFSDLKKEASSRSHYTVNT